MTDQEFEKLKAEEAALWRAYSDAKDKFEKTILEPMRLPWIEANRKLRRAEVMREIMAEGKAA